MHWHGIYLQFSLQFLIRILVRIHGHKFLSGFIFKNKKFNQMPHESKNVYNFKNVPWSFNADTKNIHLGDFFFVWEKSHFILFFLNSYIWSWNFWTKNVHFCNISFVSTCKNKNFEKKNIGTFLYFFRTQVPWKIVRIKEKELGNFPLFF